MKIKRVNLDTVIGITSEIPEMEFPEIAFEQKVLCKNIRKAW